MTNATNIEIVSHLDRGISYGESCFETVRVIKGAIFAWPAHWQRFKRGGNAFGIDLAEPLDDQLNRAILEAASQFQGAESGDDCMVRITLTGGIAMRGLLPTPASTPHIFIQCAAYVAQPPAQLTVAEFPFALQAREAKFSSDYALTLRAYQQWKVAQQWHDPVEILIHHHGRILSTMSANILLFYKAPTQTVHEGRWHTPTREGGGVLKGIVRDFFLAQAMVTESLCELPMLSAIEAAVLCNSGCFVRPVAAIGGHTFDPEHPAIEPLKQRLACEIGSPF
ncbi:MAG: aminotransferase class IV [Zetaproteobacteria bacterium]|nr:aminotransferase class IV [Zetaproteobacteria bacterium]